MSVAIWSPTIFINAVILVHRHKPNTIVVQLRKRWLISTWCQNFLRGKAAIWNCRLMLRHVTSSVTNSVTNSATPADSKEVCCQAAPEGSMHYWIDWNTCFHLTNTFYILDKSMLQYWQINILYVKHLWHIRVTTLLLGNFEAPRTIGSTAVSDQSYSLWSSHGTLAQPQDYSFFQLLPVCLERLFSWLQISLFFFI